MCVLCGDTRKPACDQDPDCAFHCFGDEHQETVGAALDDWQWFGFGRLELAHVDVTDLARRRPAGEPVSP